MIEKQDLKLTENQRKMVTAVFVAMEEAFEHYHEIIIDSLGEDLDFDEAYSLFRMTKNVVVPKDFYD